MSRKTPIRNIGVDISVGNSGAILSKLFRVICRDLNINQETYTGLMARYVRHGEINNIKDSRKSLDRELLKLAMTFKTFVKGLEFLRIEKTVFHVYLSLDNGESQIAEASFKPGKDIPGKILADLLKQVFFILGIHGDKYDSCMDAYIKKSVSIIHSRGKPTLRSALNKELANSSEITWRSFIKGLDFAQVKQLEIVVGLRHQRNRFSQHKVSVILNELETDNEADDD